MTCTHKTIDDHSYVVESDLGKRRIWKCSKCGHRACWSEGWSYLGNIECFTCQRQAIDMVLCASCSASARKR